MFGFIYKIYSPSSQQCYIGSSTKKYLSQRKAEHACFYKKYVHNPENALYYSSFDIIAQPDHTYEILFPIHNIDDLENIKYIERDYMLNELNCVNRNLPIRTKKDKKIKNNLYKTKEYKKRKRREYYLKNKK